MGPLCPLDQHHGYRFAHTVRYAFLLGSAGLYREAGYVGLSRGRHDNRLVLAHHRDDLAYQRDDPRGPAQHDDVTDPLSSLMVTLERSRRQRTATDHERSISDPR